MKRLICVVAVFAGLTGCTRSQSHTGTGMSGLKITDGTYAVRIKVNRFSSAGTAHQHLLYRAQRVCEKNDFSGFEVLDPREHRDPRSGPELSALVVCTGVAGGNDVEDLKAQLRSAKGDLRIANDELASATQDLISFDCEETTLPTHLDDPNSAQDTVVPKNQ